MTFTTTSFRFLPVSACCKSITAEPLNIVVVDGCCRQNETAKRLASSAKQQYPRIVDEAIVVMAKGAVQK
jgi:hypothetical protein